jgi:hypothetical protein
VVLDAKQAEAQQALAEVAWKSITPDRARELTGNTLSSEDGRHLVLLRGVYLDGTKGTFAVKCRHDAVLVEYIGQADDRRSIPIKNKALVARLPSLPKEVYVRPTLPK